MKKFIVGMTLGLISLSYAEKVYTDGTSDIKTCGLKDQVGTIVSPCKVTDIYYTGMEANISTTSPFVVSYVLTDDIGSLTISCKDKAYTFVLKAENKCDNHKFIVDKTNIPKIDKTRPVEDNSIIDEAKGLMKDMVNGVVSRGYDIRPVKIQSVVANDDYLKINIDTVYVGGQLNGYIGTIKNLSKFVSKRIYLPNLMEKGWILVHIEGMDGNSVDLNPEESRRIFIVAMPNADRLTLPYKQ
jgi:hypothetical protein